MTAWILFLTLANGDSGAIQTSQYVCEKTAIAVSIGDKVEADVYGTLVRVERAACHGPEAIDPCTVGETS